MATSAPKSIAVTGGSGQLGTLVIRRLANDPNVQRIISIDLKPPYVASAKLASVMTDVRDPDFARHLEGCEGLVHCAALVAGGNQADIHLVNVEGGKNVFRAAVAAGVSTIVHVSSITAYGCRPDHPVPLIEDSPRCHDTDFPYASSKYLLEQFLDCFEVAHPDVAISRIRANVLVGRHMRHLLGLSLHVGWIPDLGKAPLPIVWDEDVADLIVLALHAGARGPFNAAAGELLTAEEIAERTGLSSVTPWALSVFAYRMVRRGLSSLGLDNLSDPDWLDKMRAAMLVASSERAKRELSWIPRCATATSVITRFREVVPFAVDVRAQVLLSLWLRSLNRMSLRVPERCRINICVDGRTGRDLTLEIVDGRLSIKGGPYPGPTSTIVLRDELFRDLLAGAANAEETRREGRIVVEGEPDDWDLFVCVVDGLVERQRLRDPGAAVFRNLTAFLRLSS